MQYQKVQSASKIVQTRGTELNRKILATMKTISDIVGATLGPGGMPILIERQEAGLPALVTKDGVTVFRNLGFTDPIAHNVMETARDAAVRTVSEAGDGTSTATVLAEAIVRYTYSYIQANPKLSPQRVMRKLEHVFRKHIAPQIKSLSRTDLHVGGDGNEILRSVATVSANGDSDLADAVLECFRLVGDEGNVTIVEVTGSSRYEVERIEGYSIPIGYEESCQKFMAEFINDVGNQRVLLDKPTFILYHGQINDEMTVAPLLMKLATIWQLSDVDHSDGKISERKINSNVVLVATGFSDSVLAWLALNFKHPGALNVVPLRCPRNLMMNSEYHFLQDLAAVTGAKVMDPLSTPMDVTPVEAVGGAESFEMYRFRSTVIGQGDSDEVLDYAEQLQAQVATAESEYDKRQLQERFAKITGGIAKLKVIGASNGELKEKRDRAEDAVCSVRGAVQHGALPGGGWALLKVIHELSKLNDPVINGVLLPALAEPVTRLLLNVGMNEDEVEATIAEIQAGIIAGKQVVYDALEGKFVDAFEGGILDATPAVLEAIRNSISIASLLGILGGVVVYSRDEELERRESQSTQDFLRNAGVSEANERP